MAESLCQKRALEAFQLDPAKWGGKYVFFLYGNMSLQLIFIFLLSFSFVYL